VRVIVLEFIARLFRRQMLFIFALAIFAVVGVVATDGWSWTTGIVLAIAIFAVATFWALISFWIWIFSGANGSRGT
jgi:hypothetical protein